MSPPDRRPVQIPLWQAAALGGLQGPAELLPVSSSAHLVVVPWLLRWRYAELDGELRKSFEVALHAGTAAALLFALRDEMIATPTGLTPQRLALLGLSSLPPAIAGLALERTIETRVSGPCGTAVGLVAGAVAVAVADRRAQARVHEQAGWRDGLALGVAQACALVPGVSRHGATLAAARLRRFRRRDAGVLSRQAALPVVLGASALKALRLSRRGVSAREAAALAAGAGAAFASTLASARWLEPVERGRPLAPYAAYRVTLAGLVYARLRSERSERMRR